MREGNPKRGTIRVHLRGVGIQVVSTLAAASVLVSSAAAQSAVPGDPSNVIYSVDIGKDGRPRQAVDGQDPGARLLHRPADRTPKKDLVQPKDPAGSSPISSGCWAAVIRTAIIAVLIGLKRRHHDSAAARPAVRRNRATRRSPRIWAAQQDQIVGAAAQEPPGVAGRADRRACKSSTKLEVKEQFWLVNAFLAKVELGAVKEHPAVRPGAVRSSCRTPARSRLPTPTPTTTSPTAAPASCPIRISTCRA